MSSKLDRIYAWFQQNLEGRMASTVSDSRKNKTPAQPEEDTLVFSITVSFLSGGDGQKVFCSKASFESDWLYMEETFQTSKSIFRCCCNQPPDGRDHIDDVKISCTQILHF
jgi:hypothetical protein